MGKGENRHRLIIILFIPHQRNRMSLSHNATDCSVQINKQTNKETNKQT